MDQRKWFERRFAFPVDVRSAPELAARIRGTPARLDELLRGAEEEALVDRPGGGWSAKENAGHLLDLEELWLGRVGDVLAGETRLRHADLSNRRTHEAGHNETPTESLLGAFRESRGRLVAALGHLKDQEWSLSALHPRLEEAMTLADLTFFVAEHDDHHLARIADPVDRR